MCLTALHTITRKAISFTSHTARQHNRFLKGLSIKQYSQKVEVVPVCTAYRLNANKYNTFEFKMGELIHTFSILMVKLMWAEVAQSV